MKKYSIWTKSLAFFLAVITFLGVAVSGLGLVAAGSMDMYSHDSYDDWIYAKYEDRAWDISREVIQDYAGTLSDCPKDILEQKGLLNNVKNVENWYGISRDAWCYTIADPQGTVVADTRRDSFLEDALCFGFFQTADYPRRVVAGTGEIIAPETEVSIPADETNSTDPTMVYRTEYVDIETMVDHTTGEWMDVWWETTPEMTVTIWLMRNDGAVRGNSLSTEALRGLFRIRYALVLAIAVSVLLFAAAMVLLLTIAGRNSRTGELTPNALNRAPLDLYFLLAGVATTLSVAAAVELLQNMYNSGGYHVLFLLLLCGLGVVASTIDIAFFMAFACQCKLGDGFWWRRSICGRILLWAWKWIRRAGKGVVVLFGLLPVIWEWLLVGFFLAIILFVMMAVAVSNGLWLLMLWWWAVCALAIGYGGWCFGTIRKGIRRMNAGDLNEKIKTEYMVGSFKSIAEDLNSLADVAKIAAEKQLKSERMKTELITNVSHDIKTPLTSLINYVDLLQQPHSPEEEVQYLEVLSRQSQRMKKLLEDLMDMSKASTGNVTVEIGRLDAVEAVNQALGEFADKLDSAGLTPVFRASAPVVLMAADGRLTWRVLSNLLSNVVKYALPGTRVYLDLMQAENKVVFSVKNISREELNISAEELTERFVRGDEARNTEGSGLGLNIAQSLMALQKGNLDLTVDGDLFKVTLTFPAE